MKRGIVILTLMAAMVLPAMGAVYDVYKDGVPDTNKNPAVPPPDNSCWLATAANILGAGGWGNAATIYSDLTAQFGTSLGGNCPAAAKWWVHNIGLNSASSGYNPNTDYVNFRVISKTLGAADYDFLLDELVRCQYVSVAWQWGASLGHCMTLVGGNYATRASQSNNAVSVWHDSDDGIAGGSVRANIGFTSSLNPPYTPPGTAWQIMIGPNLAWSEEAFLECPGVPKPVSAVGNFDVHYYDGPVLQEGHYVVTPQMLTTGGKYGQYTAPDGSGGQTVDPRWDSGTQLPTLIIPNEEIVDLYKVMYISVDFHDPIPDGTLPDIDVFDDAGLEVLLDSWQWAPDMGQVLLTYVFDDQPAWEQVVFPGDEYVMLDGNIMEWNIATECVPEPVTLALLALGGLALLRRRR